MTVTLEVEVNMFPMDHADFHEGGMSTGDVDMLLSLGQATKATPGMWNAPLWRCCGHAQSSQRYAWSGVLCVGETGMLAS